MFYFFMCHPVFCYQKQHRTEYFDLSNFQINTLLTNSQVNYLVHANKKNIKHCLWW